MKSFIQSMKVIWSQNVTVPSFQLSQSSFTGNYGKHGKPHTHCYKKIIFLITL